MKGSAAALGAVGTGMLYKSWTLRPDFSDTPVRSQEPQEAPSTPESATSTNGTLVITEETRIGNPYKEQIASNYRLFEPFAPYGYVIIGDSDRVGGGAIRVSAETLEGNTRDIDLKMLLCESVIRNALDQGTNYVALNDWADFARYSDRFVFTDHSFLTEQAERDQAIQLFNPYQDGRVPEDPFKFFSQITTSLMLNGEGIKDYLLNVPKEQKTYYESANYSATETVEVDSAFVVASKELIRFAMNYFAHQAEEGKATSSDLTALFPKDGVIRYELFKL